MRPGNGFVANFQMFAKIEVNGENEHALYTYLKVRQGVHLTRTESFMHEKPWHKKLMHENV